MRATHRLVKATVLILAMAAATLAGGISMAAGSAYASSISSCASAPSNGNCNGAAEHEGDACWGSAYIVGASGTNYYSDMGYTFVTNLWYSRNCKSNFAVTTVTATGPLEYNLANKVRRGSGPDGPYLMEHAGIIDMFPWSSGSKVISPLVYSPHNVAEACVSTDSNDQAGCTRYV
jgi:hypothetical protein